MNEQIQKMILQCTDTIEVVNEDSGITHQREFFDKEKFAQLIVKECMAICKESQSAYAKYRKDAYDFQDKNIYAEGQAASDTIKYKIKKHFGVEE
jgi:hypothetical protein